LLSFGKKWCYSCDEVKNVSAFHRNKSRKDGLQGACMKCIRKADRLSYQKHGVRGRPRTKEQANDSWQRRRRNNTPGIENKRLYDRLRMRAMRAGFTADKAGIARLQESLRIRPDVITNQRRAYGPKK
jgi:hypothetical protein